MIEGLVPGEDIDWNQVVPKHIDTMNIALWCTRCYPTKNKESMVKYHHSVAVAPNLT